MKKIKISSINIKKLSTGWILEVYGNVKNGLAIGSQNAVSTDKQLIKKFIKFIENSL